MGTIAYKTIQVFFKCFFTVLIIWQASASEAALLYDNNGDCDVDGSDLYRLISEYNGDFNDVLLEFGLQFGMAEPYCDVIGIGSPIDGYPDWHERTLMVFTNMARMAPGEYRDAYMTAYTFPSEGILNDGFPAVAPLYSTHALHQSARYHTADMAFNCQNLQHDSCDGTLWYERIRSFYPEAGAISENVAYTSNISTPMPWHIVSLLLCDAVSNVCAADDQPYSVIGHRVNIMNGSYDEIGAGFASGANAYWVQDFHAAQLPPQPPIAAGSHAFVDAGAITFYLNYYDTAGSAPLEVMVVLDDQPHMLALGLGAAGAGTYQGMLPRDTGCRDYYFLATDVTGKQYRYPGEGVFNTYGEGGCTLDYNVDEGVVRELALLVP